MPQLRWRREQRAVKIPTTLRVRGYSRRQCDPTARCSAYGIPWLIASRMVFRRRGRTGREPSVMAAGRFASFQRRRAPPPPFRLQLVPQVLQTPNYCTPVSDIKGLPHYYVKVSF